MAAENRSEEESSRGDEHSPLLGSSTPGFFRVGENPSNVNGLSPELTRFLDRIGPSLRGICERQPGHKLEEFILDGITEALCRFYKHHKQDFEQAVTLLLEQEEWKSGVSQEEKRQYPKYLYTMLFFTEIPADMINILERQIQAQAPAVEDPASKKSFFATVFGRGR